MSLLVRSESHTYPVKISWPHQKALTQFEMPHPGESALGYKLKRSETASRVILLEASTENETELLNPVAGFYCIPWLIHSLVVSPRKSSCFNFSFSEYNHSTDLLGCWGRGSISGVFGSGYRCFPAPPSWIYSQHIKENPMLNMMRLHGARFKQKLGMWIWIFFCCCLFWFSI